MARMANRGPDLQTHTQTSPHGIHALPCYHCKLQGFQEMGFRRMERDGLLGVGSHEHHNGEASAQRAAGQECLLAVLSTETWVHWQAAVYHPVLASVSFFLPGSQEGHFQDCFQEGTRSGADSTELCQFGRVKERPVPGLSLPITLKSRWVYRKSVRTPQSSWPTFGSHYREESPPSFPCPHPFLLFPHFILKIHQVLFFL